MITCRACALTALVALLAALPVVGQQTGPDREPRPRREATERTAFGAGNSKQLSATTEHGLRYLVNQQHADGGWGQGGGWRQNLQNGGRIEDANVADPSDVGNTCIAVLALVRAGNTPKEGPFAANVRRGVDFICRHVEEADKDSIYVTDVRDTQLQIKIGRYVDTFLAALVLSELKAKGALPARSTPLAALDKTISKIERNQTKEGSFEGNAGWASVLSVGIASKALNRAKQAGADVKDETLDRDFHHAALALSERKLPTAMGGAAASALGGGRHYAAMSSPALAASSPVAIPSPAEVAATPSDAGVDLYFQAAHNARLQDRVNTEQADKRRAEAVIANASARPEEKSAAKNKLDQIAETEKTQREAVKEIVGRLGDKSFMAGIGNNGGEEFLSFMNIGETLAVQGGSDWTTWSKSMDERLSQVQNEDGSWAGQHCITGRTFCTSAALLTLMADRAPLPTNGNVNRLSR